MTRPTGITAAALQASVTGEQATCPAAKPQEEYDLKR